MMSCETLKIACTEVYNYVQAALDGSVKQQTSSKQVGDIMDCIRDAAVRACADFAQRWNSTTPVEAPERRLPAEILALFFHEMGFDDRVRASHVSRRWRAAALADWTLWKAYSRTEPGYEADCTEVMLDQLCVMLQRSGNVPFSVKLPKSQRRFARLEDRLVDILGPEIGRLQGYDGPNKLYERLDTAGAPMRHLRSLKIHFPDESAMSESVFPIPSDWGSNGAPDLRQLELIGSTLSIPSPCAPMLSLTHLKFHITTAQKDYLSLFQYCPNLVSLALMCFAAIAPLPHGPPPRTLIELSLAAQMYTDFTPLLAAWDGHVIHKLVLDKTRTLAHPLTLFTSSYTGPIHLSVIFPLVRMEAADEHGDVQPPWLYIAHIHQWRSVRQLGALHGACAARLSSLWICMDHLGELFDLNLSAPMLVRLELSLSRTPATLPIAPSQHGYGLVAPQLRALVLSAAFTEVQPANGSVPLLRFLRDHLRDLLGYEAPVLDSIAAKGSPPVIAALGCAELAPLASTYVEMPYPKSPA